MPVRSAVSTAASAVTVFPLRSPPSGGMRGRPSVECGC
jgi:hypothetical protein